ncbi:MAG TPA: aconitase X, partial [Usitatibacter sp.]|nr:aconitase X [Usitatibacter sp.]
MRLDSEEKAMLAGEMGPVPRAAIEHQVKVGTFFGAKDFVPVTQAHIMADTESLGAHNVGWLEALAAETKGQRTVRIPTITDPRGTDFAKSKQL